RPIGDLGLYLAGASDRPAHARRRTWLKANDRFRRAILDLLGRSGPLTSRDIPDTAAVSWASTGWSNNRNVTPMLELLAARAESGRPRRSGRERVWGLPERVYPAGVAVPSVEDAKRIKSERRLSALGIARARGTQVPVEPVTVGGTGEPAVVEGTKGEWRID